MRAEPEFVRYARAYSAKFSTPYEDVAKRHSSFTCAYLGTFYSPKGRRRIKRLKPEKLQAFLNQYVR